MTKSFNDQNRERNQSVIIQNTLYFPYISYLKRLAIITTHPIQYYAPLFKEIARDKETEIRVFYTWGEQSLRKHDPGFKQDITWDIPLLDGYEYEFFKNTAKDPGSHHSKGIINPDAISLLTQYAPDCILVIGWNYDSHQKIIRHFGKRIPVWFRGDSTLLDEGYGLKRLVKYIYLRWLYSYINTAFYVGLNNKAYFQKYGFKSNHLVFCPHSIDNTRFAEDHIDEREQIKSDLVIKENEILILFAGKFEKKKNPILLLNSFIALKPANTHLLFVGNGHLEETLKHKVESLRKQQDTQDLSSRIHFMDFQNQKAMPAVYHSCDLFCLPSSGPGETWGLAVNEAMAAGKAILISDRVGCGNDLVKAGVNGEIFQSGDKADLIIQLKKMLAKKTLNKYGNNSKEIIKNWSIKHSADSILTALKKLN